MSDQPTLYRLTSDSLASTDLVAIVEHPEGDYLMGRLVPVEPDYEAALGVYSDAWRTPSMTGPERAKAIVDAALEVSDE